MNNEALDERYLSIICDNDNVSKTTDLKECFILISAFLGIFLVLFLSIDFFANIYISNMTPVQQLQIERLLSNTIEKPHVNKDIKYADKMQLAGKIKAEIVANDKGLQNKSDFKLSIMKDKKVNALVGVDGNIYFTSGLLDKLNNDEELAFVIAHELGHYSHKHHLKAASRGIALLSVASVISAGQSSAVKNSLNSLINVTGVKYSQDQEKEADLYASTAVKKIYGTNQGGISFFEQIQKKENYPEFLYLFSTHPHPKDRIKLLKS